MNTGSLYQVKEWFWMLFPTKQTATVGSRAYGQTDSAVVAAAYWSKQYHCNVTWLPPDSFVVCLEEDGKLKKVLTSKGLIGWTSFDESYNDCFEEVKTKKEQQTAAITRISLVG